MEAIRLISRDIVDDNGRFLNPNRSVDDYTTAEKGQVEAIVLPDGWSCNPRLIEISENLHRHELSALERDEQLAEWIRLTETPDKPRQSDEVSEVSKKGGRGRKGGVAEASRQLGVSEPDARRAVQVAKLSNEAKQTARDLGLDDNRSALLAAAKATEPSEQVEALTRRATRKSAPLAAPENPLTLAWLIASEEQRLEFVMRHRDEMTALAEGCQSAASKDAFQSETHRKVDRNEAVRIAADRAEARAAERQTNIASR